MDLPNEAHLESVTQKATKLVSGPWGTIILFGILAAWAIAIPFVGWSSVRRKMHLSLIFLEFLSEMDLEVLGLPSKISAERAVLRSSERGIFEGVPDANRL